MRVTAALTPSEGALFELQQMELDDPAPARSSYARSPPVSATPT
ncbi:hypothetical protein ACFPH6_20190 [Streptomyces xiangluensis]|uniref:Uncharacterized protein n=1 Tax=Streptomyces xiangluensis TaxID=2665720 RepID=A0ABV8YRP4_9ACTN